MTQEPLKNNAHEEQREGQLQRQENYLKTAEMGMEQNYNKIDGIINNQEPPRVNCGYVIIDSDTVGRNEIVLAHNPDAVQPFVTWERDIENDKQTGREDFYWGHYYTDRDNARKDFVSRVEEKREELADRRPSIREQLKEGTAGRGIPAPAPGHKKDAPER